MRPIETRAQREARERKNKIVLGLIIVIIMVFSTVGYVLWQRQPTEQEQENLRKYNNHTFIRTENGWQTEAIPNYTSVYLPDDLENITIESESKPSISVFKNKVLFIVANDNKEQQAAYSLGTALSQFVERMQLACSEQESESDFCLENNLPIKSCEDANAQTAIIVIEKQEVEEIDESEKAEEIKTTISYEDGCLTIRGKGSELVMAAEKAVFIIFGTIE